MIAWHIFIFVLTAHLTPIRGFEEDEVYDLKLSRYNFADKCSELATIQSKSITGWDDDLADEEYFWKEYGNFIKEQIEIVKDFNSDDSGDLDFNSHEDQVNFWTIVTKPGDFLLPDKTWETLVSFAIEAKKQMSSIRGPCVDNCTIARAEFTSKLVLERNATVLESLWTSANSSISAIAPEFNTTLNFIPLAAEANSAKNAEEYWEMLAEYPSGYERARELWVEIAPLYDKLHKFVLKRLSDQYNLDSNETLIPAYLTGSFLEPDWSLVADIIVPNKDEYQYVIEALELDEPSKILAEGEKFAYQLGIGRKGKSLLKHFHNNATCPAQVATFCSDGPDGKEYSSLFACEEETFSNSMNMLEAAGKIALESMDFLSVMQKRHRHSGLRDALSKIVGLHSVKHFHTLYKPSFDDKQESEMTLLLLTALRVLPRLAYYFHADDWRLKALESQPEYIFDMYWTERTNIVKDRGISENDVVFLGDSAISFNKPYIGEFFGNILAFGLLEGFEESVFDKFDLVNCLKDKSRSSWVEKITSFLSIESIDSGPLLKFFGPLEEYLEVNFDVTKNSFRPKKKKKVKVTTPRTKMAKIALAKKVETEGQTAPPMTTELPTTPASPSGNADGAESFRENEIATAAGDNETKMSSSPAVWAGIAVGAICMVLLAYFAIRMVKRRKPKLPRNRREEA